MHRSASRPRQERLRGRDRTRHDPCDPGRSNLRVQEPRVPRSVRRHARARSSTSFTNPAAWATRCSDIANSARRAEQAGLIAFERMADAPSASPSTPFRNVLDLDAVVFTGGISRAFDLIEPHLRATMRFRSFAKPLGEVPLLVSQLHDHAGVIGAAHLPELGKR